MKESNFYSDDFEQLIRDKTEQYKMYPSERVWKGVHNSLHTKRRWFIGSMALLVTGILFFAGKELITPSAHSTIARKPASTATSVAEVPKTWLAAHIPHTALTAYHSSNSSSSDARHSSAAEDDEATEGQDPKYIDISITLSHLVIDPSNLSDWLSRVQPPDQAPEIAVIAPHPVAVDGRLAEDGLKTSARPGPEGYSGHDGDASRDGGDLANSEGYSSRSVLESLTARGEQGRNARVNGRLARSKSGGDGIGGDGLLPDSAANFSKASATVIAEAQDRQRVNWLHDYALNTLPAPTKRGRTYFQLTLSPTVNYRSVSGLDPSYEKWGPSNNFSGSPAQMINSSPALGFEFGGSILYRLTRNFSVKGGLRFNFARYKITAFGDSVARQHTNFDSYFGYVQGMASQASAAQQRGNAPPPGPAEDKLTLNNDYYQLSAPIGFELRVLGNERLQFNLGASVQPSYLLGTTSYMLSQDLTKYSKDPARYRRWNVSGGIEAFLSYRVGNIRWQIGPEFRYQFMSTYTSQSFSENLKTYGLKIGITKALP
ncbi:MAG TPA: outer membrane beta-barrel protein [Puia sp.]